MYLLFDIGGTKMRFGTFEDGKKIKNLQIIETPKTFSEGLKVFKSMGLSLSEGKKIKAVAGGIAGPLDKDKNMLVKSPNLSNWVRKPLKKELKKMFDVPVYLENDAVLVGLGEAVFGAGKGQKIVMYMTVSTGVGGARFVDGKIDQSAIGFEPGHQIIDIKGAICPTCNTLGHLEGYVSGTALKNKYGKNPEEITDKKIWNEVAHYLAYGIHNSLLHWSPNVIVLGGSMMKSISLEKVIKYLNKIILIFPNPPKVKKANLGDIGGLYGALAYLNKQYEQ